MAKIPLNEISKAHEILRFARVSVFHPSKHTFPIQWHTPEHREEAFSLYNLYSGFSWQPEKGLKEGADEKVFNWLIEEALTDIVPAIDAFTGAVKGGFPTSNN